MRKSLLLAALTTSLLTGCSFGYSFYLGGLWVDKSKVEETISHKLTKAGEQVKAVTCPGDLKGEVGTTMRCQMQDGSGILYEVTATVTSVEDDWVNFDIESDGSATAMEESTVERKTSDALADQFGERPKAVTCPGNLTAKLGTTMRCWLQDSTGTTYGTTVTVTSLTEDEMKFYIKVDDRPSADQ